MKIATNQFSFQNVCKFNYCFIITLAGVSCFGRKYRNSIINTVMKGEVVVPEVELPADGIKVIFLVCKKNFQVCTEDVGDLVKSFEATIIINNGFSASERSS